MAQSPSMKNIAQAVAGQPTWKDLGLSDLRGFDATKPETAPSMMDGASSLDDAVAIIRSALGIAIGDQIAVQTPVETVVIKDSSLLHVVEKRSDQRERFARFVLPTLQRPTEIWRVAYDDGSHRNRYIKLFTGARYDLLVMVKVREDGSVFWNMMQRDRKGMNALRLGELISQ